MEFSYCYAMAAQFKDYYAILGVSREATDEEIKKAFRKLARLYHPDVAKDKKAAEEKFKEINEANEVLSDPTKRKRYDELGAHWNDPVGAAPPPGARGRSWQQANGPETGEFHFGGTGFSDFFEQFFGRSGRAADSFEEEDFAEGRMRKRSGRDIEGDMLVTLDEVVNGSERTISLQRTDPRTGETINQNFKVRIPPGAEPGRRIRVPGKGEEGVGGGAAGDLFLRVSVEAHPDFQVRGTDLVYDLDLAPWEAVLGTSVTVPTLSGRIKLQVPAGSTQGRQLRVRGQGLPKRGSAERGNLYVVVTIQVPDQTSEEERVLWEKLKELSHFDPRAV